jgi:hypothetical protein
MNKIKKQDLIKYLNYYKFHNKNCENCPLSYDNFSPAFLTDINTKMAYRKLNCTLRLKLMYDVLGKKSNLSYDNRLTCPKLQLKIDNLIKFAKLKKVYLKTE